MPNPDARRINLNGGVRRTFSSARWLMHLTRQVFAAAPGSTVLVVAATFLSQGSIVIAFFMPVKILFLFQEDRVPQYFPDAVRDFDVNQLAIYMAVISVAAYLLSTILERLISVLIDTAVSTTLANRDRLPVLEKMGQSIEQGYRAYCLALGGIAFLPFSLSIVGFAYPLVFILLSIYLSVACSFLLKASANRTARDRFLSRLPKTLRAISTFGFFLVFAGVLTDHLVGGGPNLILVLLSILFARQALSQSASAVEALTVLFRDRDILDLGFFEGPPSGTLSKTRSNPALDLVLTNDWESMVRLSLSAQVGLDVKEIRSIIWSETSQHPSVDLLAEVASERDCYDLLVRIYPPNRRGHANKERGLLALELPGIPSPKLISSTQIGDCDVLVLDVSGYTTMPTADKPGNQELTRQISETRLSTELEGQYRRSVASFRSKITQTRLRPAKRIAELSGVPLEPDRIARAIRLARDIDSLPLQLVNPDARHPYVMASAEGQLIATHWSRWSLKAAPGHLHDRLRSGGGFRPSRTDTELIDSQRPAIDGSDLATVMALDRALDLGDVAAVLRIIRRQAASEEAEEPEGPRHDFI